MRFLSLLVPLLVVVPSVFGIRLLNDPKEQVQSRVKILENIKEKLAAVEKGNLIKNETTIKKVLGSINQVLTEFKGKSEKDKNVVAKLDKAIKSIRSDVKALQSELIARAKELQQKQDAALKEHKDGMKKHASEEAFDKLMDAQDLPVKKQKDILVKYQEDVAVAKEMMKEQFPEGSNLAFEFGKRLDDAKWEAKKAEKNKELKALEVEAHISEKQAKSLMPILNNLKKQKMSKTSKLQLISYNIRRLDTAERDLKKQRGVLAKETRVLDRAIHSIEHGEAKKVAEAMKELKTIA